MEDSHAINYIKPSFIIYYVKEQLYITKKSNILVIYYLVELIFDLFFLYSYNRIYVVKHNILLLDTVIYNPFMKLHIQNTGFCEDKHVGFNKIP